MGISFRAQILEYYFLYHLVSETERKLTHTKEEVQNGILNRYNWTWDDDFEIALGMLKTERLSRGQSGLLDNPENETFSWHTISREEECYWTSNFFTATHIESEYQLMKDARSEIDFEQIYSDAVYAYEKIKQESFQEGLEREEREYEQRGRESLEKSDGIEISDIPF